MMIDTLELTGLIATRQVESVLIPIVPVPAPLATAVIALLATFIVITWTTLLLRFFTRLFFLRLGPEDWFMLLTMVIYTPESFAHQ